MTPSMLCLPAAVLAIAAVGLQVLCQEPVQPTGPLESLAVRAQDALQTWWQGARSQAGGVVQGVVRGFRRQEHDALQAASVQLGDLGVDVDLTEAGDNVGDELYGCAKGTQDKYARLLTQLRRRVQRCWGWESREVTALVQAVEDLILAGDRLPALLRANMDICLKKGQTKPKGRPTWTKSGHDKRPGNQTTTPAPPAPPGPPGPPGPSPFRLLRCTADSVNLTWTYVSSVPREVGRAARRTASLLGSSREDWAGCARGVVRQCAGSAMQVLRDLGMCVADRVSEQSWQQMHQAWQQPKR